MSDLDLTVREADGSRGGEYLIVDLPDGRELVVSRKRNGDRRVWLGRPNDPSSWEGDPIGGIGSVDKVLDEWVLHVALDEEVATLYFALRALDVAQQEARR